MKITISALLLLAVTAPIVTADTIALWTFETSVPTTAGPYAPEDGSGSAVAWHSSISTVYSNPVGNGSGESWSSNYWAVGDYYQFQVSTLGFEDITLAWDQTKSSTGPAEFRLSYGTNGTTWTALHDYTLGSDTWSSGSYQSASTFSPAGLSALGALDDASSIYFRLEAMSAPTNSSGTSRIDNFTVSGTSIASVPEGTPGVVGLAGVLALLAAVRKRWVR